jgi:hypothetical protein
VVTMVPLPGGRVTGAIARMRHYERCFSDIE